MKSILISALALGVAVADSQYYIGNYTASGQVNWVPYPLGVCVTTGALSSIGYSVFNCDGDDNIEQKKYASGDSTCSEAFTTITIPRKNVPGLEGYANCDGPVSYMVINQYAGSCQSWKQGKAGVATTVIAVDACTYAGQEGGINLYSRTVCTGNGQETAVYAEENTCSVSAAIVLQKTDPLECHFFGAQGGIQIYSAQTKCVVDGVTQRCSVPLTNYEAVLTFEDVEGEPDYSEVYGGLFEYSTVEVTPMNGSVHLNLGFCTQYEDVKYASAVENLGQTTLDSTYINDDATVCWTCLGFTCGNSTLCGTDDYCTTSEQCITTITTSTSSTSLTSTELETTEQASSVSAIYTSLALVMGLILSWTLF